MKGRSRELLLGQLIGQLALLLAIPVLTRLLSTSEMGIYQSGFSIALILQPLATLRRELLIPVTDGQTSLRHRTVGLKFAALCSGITTFISIPLGFAGYRSLAELSLVTGLILMSLAIISIENAYLIRHSQFRRLAARNLLAGTLSAILQIAAAFFIPTSLAVAASLLIGRALATFITMAHIKVQTNLNNKVEQKPQHTISAILGRDGIRIEPSGHCRITWSTRPGSSGSGRGRPANRRNPHQFDRPGSIPNSARECGTSSPRQASWTHPPVTQTNASDRFCRLSHGRGSHDWGSLVSGTPSRPRLAPSGSTHCGVRHSTKPPTCRAASHNVTCPYGLRTSFTGTPNLPVHHYCSHHGSRSRAQQSRYIHYLLGHRNCLDSRLYSDHLSRIHCDTQTRQGMLLVQETGGNLLRIGWVDVRQHG